MPVPSNPPPPPAPGLRRYLYFTAAVTGAAIMIVEILGAKMLAPYIGTSHFVWTAQIAVTLVALATGYYLGGRLVDRSPRLERLYWAIVLAAVYLAGTVPVVEPLAYRCLGFKLAVGSLLASALLYFVPLALLAMVGPFFVRSLTVAVGGVGGNVGRLTAISTLGSFAGTLLIGYVFIPLLRNSATMCLTTAALLAVSGGYFLGWGRKRASPATLTGCLLVTLALGAWGLKRDQPLRRADWQERCRANSNFGMIQVIDTRGGAFRFYLNDFLPQNGWDPKTRQSIFTFTYLLHGLASGYAPKIETVLVIGLGVGIVPMQFAREGARVDVVEINPAIVPIAKQYFGLETERLNLTLGDGRNFVNECQKQYDAIVLDAFLGDSVPSHLMSRETFARIHEMLRPGGVLVINSFGGSYPGEGYLSASLHKTLKAVFRSVRMHTAQSGNVFFAASDQVELQLRNVVAPESVHESCRQQVLDALESVQSPPPDQGIVLTDDFNPADYFDAPNREQTRRQLVRSIHQQ